jgi:hypothetical protein
MFLDRPRGFRDPELIGIRNQMLKITEAVLPLEAWARDVEDRRRARLPDVIVPHFDPAEAGVSARALLLLEAPGPKTVPEWGGSGFISVDNNDVTAQNTWNARNDAGLHDHTLAWNILHERHAACCPRPAGRGAGPDADPEDALCSRVGGPTFRRDTSGVRIVNVPFRIGDQLPLIDGRKNSRGGLGWRLRPARSGDRGDDAVDTCTVVRSA